MPDKTIDVDEKAQENLQNEKKKKSRSNYSIEKGKEKRKKTEKGSSNRWESTRQWEEILKENERLDQQGQILIGG